MGGSETRQAARGSSPGRGKAARRSADAGPRANTRESRIRPGARSRPPAPRAAPGPPPRLRRTRRGRAWSPLLRFRLERGTRHEVDPSVGRVAEGLLRRVAAATQPDGVALDDLVG